MRRRILVLPLALALLVGITGMGHDEHEDHQSGAAPSGGVLDLEAKRLGGESESLERYRGLIRS